MSQPLVSCPHCHTLLRSDRPIPPGIALRCPDCKSSFPAPPPLPLAAEEPRLFGPAFFLAATISVLLGGALLGAAWILSRPQPAAVVDQLEPSAPRSDAERQRLETERRQLEEDRQRLEAERKKLDLTRVLARGEEALKKDRFAEAEQAFEEALRLVPGDAAAVRGLVAARTGLATAARTKQDDSKRQAEIDRLLADARKAMDDKSYSRAVQLLESARALAPAHRGVLDALHDARNALDADQFARKAQGDFRKHMDAGRAALDAERYADAVREYLAALRLMPEDLEAQQGRKQAEARLAALADNQKKRDAVADMLERGQRALTGKRYNEAVAAFEAALRLAPDDREAQRGLRQARTTLKQVRSENSKLLAEANEAARSGRLEEAQRLAEQAAGNWPEDAQAEKMVKALGRQVDDTRSAQAAYLRYLQQAALAMTASRYADAVASYTEALRLVPGDLEVARQLRLARVGLEREVRFRVDYDRHLRAGNGQLARRSFADAIKSFQAALQLLPDDPVAAAGLSKARYAQAMLDGQKALTQRRRKEAIDAFESALAERPADHMAQNGLRMARALP